MQQEVTFDDAMVRKYPEQIAIAIARDPQGKFNPITLGWAMNTSIDPPMLAVSIGTTRYSLEALRASSSFVVSFPSAAMVDDVVFFGRQSGREVDKLAACQTPTQPATKIDGVLLSDAVANFECERVSEHTTGDHVIFVGRVVAAHVHQDESVRRIYSLGNRQMGSVVPG